MQQCQHCKKRYIEITPCYLIYMNHALSTPIMNFWYVSPPISVYLNQVAGTCLCYGTYTHVLKSVLAKLTLKPHKKIKKLYILRFSKPYIKMLINQHFNFLFEPVTSHCSACCYDLFQTI